MTNKIGPAIGGLLVLLALLASPEFLVLALCLIKEELGKDFVSDTRRHGGGSSSSKMREFFLVAQLRSCEVLQSLQIMRRAALETQQSGLPQQATHCVS